MKVEDVQYAVRMRDISKVFGPVRVLEDVSLDVLKGEVHALVGGNGAGKSTLMKILQGVYLADSGTIEIDGAHANITGIENAKQCGVGMVFQEFSLIPTLTIAQNIFLNSEPVKHGVIADSDMEKRARAIFADLGLDLDPSIELRSLPTALWQITEIAKALAADAKVLIMDEPTAALAQHEARALFALIQRLKAKGVGIIYISHRMQEIYEIADTVTILRNGKQVATGSLAEITPEQIVAGIAGKAVELSRPEVNDCESRPVVLEMRDVFGANGLHDITLTVREGEVVGLAGLMGSGRTELANLLFGVERVTQGQVFVDAEPVTFGSPRDAMKAGIALVPEDRRIQGLVLTHSVSDNLVLTHLDQQAKKGFLSKVRLANLSSKLVKRYRVKVAHPSSPVGVLSGGNQQKVVLAKWLSRGPRVLILDEPTAGIDIGAKSEIVNMIRSFAAQGHAVIAASSEYQELLAMSDRIVIMKDKSIAQEIAVKDLANEGELELAVQGVESNV